MSKRKKQYYVVVNGRRPGIYETWFGEDGAADQVQNYPEALYKGFYTREAALEWLDELEKEDLSQMAPELLDLIEPYTVDEGAENFEEILAAGKVLIHTDGGAFPNPGRGGYGVVLRYKDHKKELGDGFRLTTNNRMEILACIKGLQALTKKSSVVLYSDSRYVVDSMTEGWASRWRANGWMKSKKHAAENTDLWEQLLNLCEQHEVEFRWTQGHAGNEDNERCDQLAAQYANRDDLPADDGYETGDTHGLLPLFPTGI
jgi:ribonuclease HI